MINLNANLNAQQINLVRQKEQRLRNDCKAIKQQTINIQTQIWSAVAPLFGYSFDQYKPKISEEVKQVLTTYLLNEGSPVAIALLQEFQRNNFSNT